MGAILRTADAAGVSCVYLCGYTPSPRDRFGRMRKDIAKVALGAENTVPFAQIPDTLSCLVSLKKKGVQVVAVEQAPTSIPYTQVRVEKPTALVLGEEVHGLTRTALDRCDIIAEIPMYGSKESLNVSVAAGILLFAIRQQSA